MEELTLTKFECKRCGHTWIPRKIPVNVCPKCNSWHWKTEKKNKNLIPAETANVTAQ